VRPKEQRSICTDRRRGEHKRFETRDEAAADRYQVLMAEQFTKHRQPWKADEVAKLRVLAAKGKGLKEIAKALSRSEESTKERAKIDGIGIAKLR
jgi:hypothetical protein